MRLATLLAAMRRGWVWPIRRPRLPSGALQRPRPSARAILGNCVVLPEPVSPHTMMTWCAAMAAMISSRRLETGRDSGKVICKGIGARIIPAWGCLRPATGEPQGCGPMAIKQHLGQRPSPGGCQSARRLCAGWRYPRNCEACPHGLPLRLDVLDTTLQVPHLCIYSVVGNPTYELFPAVCCPYRDVAPGTTPSPAGGR